MFGRLENIDAFFLDAAERRCCIQTDHRTAEEIRQQEELSILFALARVLCPFKLGDPREVEVVYVCAEPPPDFLRHAIASAGGRVAIRKNPPVPYDGILSLPEDLADAAFRRLAGRVLRERGAPLEERTLVELRRSYAQGPSREENEPEYWARVAELAALTGELLRARWGGRWVHRQGLAALPFAFSHPIAGSTRRLVSNVVGAAEHFLIHGEQESLTALLAGGEDHVSPSPQPRPVLLSLKAMDWPEREEMCCQPLLARSEPRGPIPWLAYGEDLPRSFRYFSKEETRGQDLDALHARALENLKAIQVEVGERELLGNRLLAVAGHFYAAEKVLDVDFMRSLHERLGAAWLIVGIPHRGLLYAMKAQAEGPLMKGFVHACEAQFRKGTLEPITPTPLLLHEGRISGFAWEEDIRAALAGEAPAEPKRGFFSRLFGRKKGR